MLRSLWEACGWYTLSASNGPNLLHHEAPVTAVIALEVLDRGLCTLSRAGESLMQTAGGAVFKTKLFTLPRIWKQLQVRKLEQP